MGGDRRQIMPSLPSDQQQYTNLEPIMYWRAQLILLLVANTAAGVGVLHEGDIVVGVAGDNGVNQIVRISQDGSLDAITSGGHIRNGIPKRVAIDSDGSIIALSTQAPQGSGGGNVVRIDPATGRQWRIAGIGGSPTGLAVRSDGLIGVTNAAVRETGLFLVDPDLGVPSPVSSVEGGLSDVAADESGDFYVVRFSQNAEGIYRVEPETGDQFFVAGGFYYNAIESDASGSLVTTGSAAFDGPFGIYRTDLSVGTPMLVADLGFGPLDVAVDAEGDFIITNNLTDGNWDVRRIDGTDGIHTVLATREQLGGQPYSVAFVGDPGIIPEPLSGDYNGNGFVEHGDLDLVLLYWGLPGDPLPLGWDGEQPTGITEQNELDRVLLNWGARKERFGDPAPAPVPEPATGMLLIIALSIALILRCRRVGGIHGASSQVNDNRSRRPFQSRPNLASCIQDQ
jgi:hypothetical protein